MAKKTAWIRQWLFIAALPLAACAELTVQDVSAEWNSEARKVHATIMQTSGTTPLPITVRFELLAAKEGAGSVVRDEQVVFTAAAPQAIVTADFAALAKSDRYALEGYSSVRVTVDPGQTLRETDRSDDARTLPLPLLSGPPGLVPTLSPLESRGDDLYATYRRGLIERHIAQNGRFMQVLALRSVPRFDPSNPDEFWAKVPNGRIPVPTSAGPYVVPVENARYSLESETECSSESCPEASPHLWVPLLAPLKNPGATNDARWVLSADGDNPNYFGGMALALFSLEAKHGVSPHSITYARKLVEFMLRSEIPASGGYVARRAHEFLTTPTLRGGSAEELIGIFLGLEFYLRVEDSRHPLYEKAKALRDGIVDAVNAASWLDMDSSFSFSKSAAYAHPYFTNTFPAKHLLFALLASQGSGTQARWWDARTVFSVMYDEYYRGCGTSCPFWQLAEMAALMLVVLESPLSNGDKRSWADIYERWLEAVVAHEGDDARLNGFLAVTRDAMNRVKNGAVSGDDDFSRGRALVTSPVASGRSTAEAELLWNHDLPLDPGPGGHDYNPPVATAGRFGKRIGSEFVWLDRLPMVMSSGTNVDRCPYALPGWPADNASCDYAGAIGSAERWFSAAEYLASPSKTFAAKGYAEKELSGLDVQLEGAGLDLLFPRMLLTELDPVRYPPPRVTDGPLPVLPFDGPGILPPAESLQMLDHLFAGYGVTYEGARTLALASVEPGYLVGAITGGGYQTSPNVVRIVAWMSDGGTSPRTIGFASAGFGEKVVLAPLGPNRFAVVKRSSSADLMTFWLEVQLWAVDDKGPRYLSGWTGPSRQLAARDISAAAIDPETLAVAVKGWEANFWGQGAGKNWLRVFRMTDNAVVSLVRNDKRNIQDGTDQNENLLKVLTSRGGRVHYPVYDGKLTWFSTLQWQPASSTFTSVGATSEESVELLDAAVMTVGAAGQQYLVAAMKERTAGSPLSLRAWAISDADGSLTYTGAWSGTSGDSELLTREQDWKLGRLASRESPFGAWFVLAGKAPVLRSSAASGGTGMKLLHGRILPDGRPTVEGMAVAGEGTSGMPFDLAVTGDARGGIFSLHLGAAVFDQTFANRQVHLIQWAPRDEQRCILRCEEVGAECGELPDGCGGTVTCPGSCTAPETCGGGGLPGFCDCTASCTGRCGGSDGCSGSCPDICSGFETCGGGGVTDVCGCTPICSGRCGVPDGCGGTCPDRCTGFETCGGGGASGLCGCTPLASCAGLCGPHSDGCGGSLACPPCESPAIELASVDSSGLQGNGHSNFPDLSADGQRVVFASLASNLVPGDTNSLGRAYDYDIFVHDRRIGATSRVDVSTSGTQADQPALVPLVDDAPVISADGRVVAFSSLAANLGPGDTNGTYDVYVRDLEAGVTERVSFDPGGAQLGSSCLHPGLSADGRFVTFATSSIVNVAQGLVWVRDRAAGATSLESLAADGTAAPGSEPSISGDGSIVVYASSSRNIDPEHPTPTGWQIYARDRTTGRTTLVSRSTLGVEAGSGAGSPALSQDGRFVAFVSGSENLVPGDTNRMADVFVHDRITGQTTRASVASDGTQANAACSRPRLSADGRFVVFSSRAANLVPGDANGAEDVFVHDRLSGETTRASVSGTGNEGNGASVSGTVSADGSTVAFSSAASNFVPVDANGFMDVFVRSRP